MWEFSFGWDPSREQYYAWDGERKIWMDPTEDHVEIPDQEMQEYHDATDRNSDPDPEDVYLDLEYNVALDSFRIYDRRYLDRTVAYLDSRDLEKYFRISPRFPLKTFKDMWGHTVSMDVIKEPEKIGKMEVHTGALYDNISGGTFRAYSDGSTAMLSNISSGWTFVAHEIQLYDNGKIEWAYSTGGHYDKSRAEEE